MILNVYVCVNFNIINVVNGMAIDRSKLSPHTTVKPLCIMSACSFAFNLSADMLEERGSSKGFILVLLLGNNMSSVVRCCCLSEEAATERLSGLAAGLALPRARPSRFNDANDSNDSRARLPTNACCVNSADGDVPLVCAPGGSKYEG